MDLIKKIWNGELPLFKVYWLYGLVVGFFSVVLIQLLKDSRTSIIFISLALIPYQVLVLVGIWRSASNYNKNKLWMILAKIHVVLSAIIQLSSLIVISQSFSFSNNNKLTNCIKCEDGKCEPHTYWRNAVLKLSPNDNSMLITNELWEKDEDGKFINDVTFNSKEKNSSTSLLSFPTCAIKTIDEGFCKVRLERSQYDNDIILTDSSFDYKDGKFVLTHNRQFFNAVTERLTLTSITTHECS